MTPNGEQFFTLTSDFQGEFLTFSWWFGISDCHNAATKAIVDQNHYRFLHKFNSSHIFLHIVPSHSLFWARIFHSDTQARLQFRDTDTMTVKQSRNSENTRFNETIRVNVKVGGGMILIRYLNTRKTSYERNERCVVLHGWDHISDWDICEYICSRSEATYLSIEHQSEAALCPEHQPGV